MANINIGFDFGTTYTSCFRLTNNGFESLLTSKGNNLSQPTLAVWNGEDESLKFGSLAQNELLKVSSDTTQYKILRGFKMLIGNMSDQNLISRNDYEIEGTISPAEITKSFLTLMLKNALKACPKDTNKIETVVIGVPEIWINNKESFNSLPKLKDIFDNIKNDAIPDKLGNIIYESEPALACAYFAYNYKGNTKKDFSGYMLVIDYGGGTLDINLCEVIQNDNSCEIAVRARGGDGINNKERGILGKAGLAYMQDVVEKIIGDNSILPHERHSREQLLENLLMDNKVLIEEEFERVADDPSLKKFLDEPFEKNFYKGKHLTYNTLQEVFEEKICTVLVPELEKIYKIMLDEFKIDAKNQDFEDKFKIVLTGGFCNYYLTQKKILDFFNIIGKSDNRIENMDISVDGMRYAIAYGATLVAEGKVKIRKTYKFSLGFVSPPPNNSKFIAFKYGDDVKFGEPQYVKAIDMDGKIKEINTPFSGGGIFELFFDIYGMGDFKSRRIKEAYREFLKVPAGNSDVGKIFNVGFSLNEDDSIDLYINEVHGADKDYAPIGKPIIHHLPSLFKILYDELEDLSEN